ncbi:MAG: DUF1576 domain-containing protein [Defluviitaleaceae bacterium]|nr:DUF1576 domain-containing protein [Defluviitaleaceae bacterium]
MKTLHEAFLKSPYRVHSLLFVIFIIAGFLYDSPIDVINGLRVIFTNADILVTDYIYTAGFGAALVNSGLSGLLVVAALVIARHEPVGLTMGTFGLTMGIGFFGKNPLNMLPIILGGFLYAKFAGKHYRECVLRAVLATCLAPAVTQVAFVSGLPMVVSIVVGIGVGLLIGFLINPVAIHDEPAHMGYNLYNVGFAAGFLGMAIFAFFSLIGASFYTLEYWSSGYDLQLIILLVAVSIYFIVCGVLSQGEKLSLRSLIFMHKNDNDYFRQFREKSYIHMGILGFACLGLMLVLRGEFNGPVIGAILSVIGFGAFGKALFSAAPVVFGAILAALASWAVVGAQFNQRGFLVAIFFSTCLSPFAKKYGVGWGIAAGFLHLSLAMNIGGFHGGMNLYNNGFAGGLSAMILLPIVMFFRREKV